MNFYQMYIEDFDLKSDVIEIFHYCPREVLFDIVDINNKNITLRSKEKEFFTNDPTECKWFWENLEIDTKNAIANEIGITISRLDEIITGTQIFVTCFSMSSDSPYMWKNYGKSDKACNIGLNFHYSNDYNPLNPRKRLRQITCLKKHSDYSNDLFGFFGKVEYLNKEEVNQRALSILEICRNQKIKYAENYSEVLIQYLYCLQILIKNPSNDHPLENEFRAFFTLKNNDTKIKEEAILVSFNIDDQYGQQNTVEYFDKEIRKKKFVHSIRFSDVLEHHQEIDELGIQCYRAQNTTNNLANS